MVVVEISVVVAVDTDFDVDYFENFVTLLAVVVVTKYSFAEVLTQISSFEVFD